MVASTDAPIPWSKVRQHCLHLYDVYHDQSDDSLSRRKNLVFPKTTPEALKSYECMAPGYKFLISSLCSQQISSMYAFLSSESFSLPSSTHHRRSYNFFPSTWEMSLWCCFFLDLMSALTSTAILSPPVSAMLLSYSEKALSLEMTGYDRTSAQNQAGTNVQQVGAQHTKAIRNYLWMRWERGHMGAPLVQPSSSVMLIRRASTVGTYVHTIIGYCHFLPRTWNHVESSSLEYFHYSLFSNSSGAMRRNNSS